MLVVMSKVIVVYTTLVALVFFFNVSFSEGFKPFGTVLFSLGEKLYMEGGTPFYPSLFLENSAQMILFLTLLLLVINQKCN